MSKINRVKVKEHEVIQASHIVQHGNLYNLELLHAL